MNPFGVGPDLLKESRPLVGLRKKVTLSVLLLAFGLGWAFIISVRGRFRIKICESSVE